jgi:DNA-binding transcriptional ArsR family regulator
MSATRASTTRGSDPKASVEAINAELFRALGHPVRVRVLELLQAREEMSVRDLQAALQSESGGASQHLSAMRRQGLLATRRQGTSVLYRVRDPRTFQLLDVARQVLASQYEYTQTLIAGLNDTRPPQATPATAQSVDHRKPAA